MGIYRARAWAEAAAEAVDQAVARVVAEMWQRDLVMGSTMLNVEGRLGEASDVYELAGDLDSAARCAERAGEFERALPAFEEALRQASKPRAARIMPMTGTFSRIRSTVSRNFGYRFQTFDATKTKAPTAISIAHNQAATKSDILTTISVNAGRSAPKLLNRSLNCGMTKIMMIRTPLSRPKPRPSTLSTLVRPVFISIRVTRWEISVPRRKTRMNRVKNEIAWRTASDSIAAGSIGASFGATPGLLNFWRWLAVLRR